MFGAAIGACAGGITFELTGSYYSFFLIGGVLEFPGGYLGLLYKTANYTLSHANILYRLLQYGLFHCIIYVSGFQS